IWYDPHGYTLAELRQLIDYLKKLHQIDTNADANLNQLIAPPPTKVIDHDRLIIKQQQRSMNSVDINVQRLLARTPAHQIHEGERNLWLFSNISLNFCRKVADKYRNDPSTFMAVALAKARELNNCLNAPLPFYEVFNTVKSVVNWCLSPRYRPL